MTGEATPNYLFFPNVPELVYNTCSNAKFIVLLRNPIDRAYSQYHHQIRKKLQPPRDKERETLSLNDAIKEEEKRLEGEIEKISNDKSYQAEKFRNFSYLARSIYSDQLERWFKFFPKKQFLIIKTEEFSENPQDILNDVFDFLDIPKFQLQNLPRLNIGKYEKMDESIRKYLIEYFKPHNEKLYKLLGRNMNWDM